MGLYEALAHENWRHRHDGDGDDDDIDESLGDEYGVCTRSAHARYTGWDIVWKWEYSKGAKVTHRHPSFVKPYPRLRMWLPIVVHSAPLMTPMFLTLRIVKNRSLSARSFQFLFMADGGETEQATGLPDWSRYSVLDVRCWTWGSG